MKPFGVLCPIVTPCNRAGEIDFDGLVSVTQYMLDHGCAGIFVAGSTGRGPWFSLATKIKICRAVRDQVGEKVPVFAGCAGSGLIDMLENAKAMKDAGSDVIVLTAPGYFNYSQSEIESIFLQFADQSQLPVLMYDIPVFAGIKLSTDVVSRLANHENIIGLKDSSADYDRFLEFISLLKDRSDFHLFQGKENLLAQSIERGASGLVVSLLHINPKPYVDLYKAASSGDQTRANELQTTIDGMMDIVVKSFERRPEISTLFHFFNVILKQRGICENIVLEHEGPCPDWIEIEAKKAMQIT